MGYHLIVHQRHRRGPAPSTASRSTTVRKIHEGRPNLLDHLANGAIDLIVNTPSGKGARTDEGRIRASAVSHGVPCITTIAGARAAVAAMERLRAGQAECLCASGPAANDERSPDGTYPGKIPAGDCSLTSDANLGECARIVKILDTA